MAAEGNVTIIAEVSGLGKLLSFAEKFTMTATPTRALYHYDIQDTTNTAQALDVGDVGTIELIVIKCIANDLDIDTSYVSSFSAEIEVQEGEVAIFKPTGTVYVQNDDTDELSTFEYLVIGTA